MSDFIFELDVLFSISSLTHSSPLLFPSSTLHFSFFLLFFSLSSSTFPPSSSPPPPYTHTLTVNIHHVYSLSAHPTQPSSLISAVSYNNEISIWDMETASRRQMLWASPAPAFGEMTGNVRANLQPLLLILMDVTVPVLWVFVRCQVFYNYGSKITVLLMECGDALNFHAFL